MVNWLLEILDLFKDMLTTLNDAGVRTENSVEIALFARLSLQGSQLKK